MTMMTNSFSSKAQIAVGGGKVELYRLDALVKAGVGDVATLPYALRILLENLLRYEDGKTVQPADIRAVAGWDPKQRVEPVQSDVAAAGCDLRLAGETVGRHRGFRIYQDVGDYREQ